MRQFKIAVPLLIIAPTLLRHPSTEMDQSNSSYRTSKTLYAWFFVALAAASVLPFLVLSFYSHPVSDDYLFSGYYKELGWWNFQKFFYLKWQGTYTTNAIMCSPINPVVHNRFDLYWVVCWFALAAMAISIWLLLNFMTKNKLAASIITCTVLITYLYQTPSPAQGLYWLNANWGYQLSTTLGIILFLVLLKTFQGGVVKRGYWLLSAILLAVLMGTNFIVAMLVGFGVGMATLLSLRSKATRFWWAGLLLIASLSLIAVVFAPGNAVRLQDAARDAATLHAQTSATSKVAHGISHGIGLIVYSFINWLGNGVILAFSILLLPVLFAVSKNPDTPLASLARKKYFILAVGITMLVMPFFPTYLAQGAPPATRITNMIYLLFIFVWLFALYIGVLWMRRAATNHRQPVYVSVAMAVFLLAALLTDANYSLTYAGKGRDFNNIAAAYKDWLGGEAKQFDKQQRMRYEVMQKSGREGIELDSLSARPQTIFLDDLYPDSAHWANQAYAKFFDKKYVIVDRKKLLP